MIDNQTVSKKFSERKARMLSFMTPRTQFAFRVLNFLGGAFFLVFCCALSGVIVIAYSKFSSGSETLFSPFVVLVAGCTGLIGMVSCSAFFDHVRKLYLADSAMSHVPMQEAEQLWHEIMEEDEC